ncbi:hypothetical protein [Marisediminicola senii]|uniref:hypothetical protein n=1 Tax=Marisediminicola senii TaxID=2711233 RepID=UPI0013EB36B3|nr:hypothetical protein [Marisediminicola senii]
MYVAFIVVAILGVVSATPLAWDRRPAQRGRVLDKYARRVNLAMTPEVEPLVVARLVAREKSMFSGAMTGIGIGLIGSLLLPGGVGSSLVPLALVAGMLLGLAAGAAVSSVRGQLAVAGDGPRVARMQAPGFADYVGPIERWGARGAVILAALSVVGAAIALSVGALGEARMSAVDLVGSGAVAGAVASIVALIGAELFAARIVAHRQPAGSTTELAWEDAIRAMTLRDLVSVPFVLGFVSAVMTFLLVGSNADTAGAGAPAALVGMAVLLIVVTTAISLSAASWASKPMQHYWRRLWAKPEARMDAASA